MKNLTFGIDEAGRGPLAGPVSVGVFGLKKGFRIKGFPEGKDSKKMSESEREKWFEIFNTEKEKGNVFFEVGFGTAKMIDGKGIVKAIRFAMETCLKKLEKEGRVSVKSKILLDGALHAPERFTNQKTIIKGDEKEKLIACASIVAKVSRDRLMHKLSKKYKQYDFHVHKGYGTKKHREAIRVGGLSAIHRASFCKNLIVDMI